MGSMSVMMPPCAAPHFTHDSMCPFYRMQLVRRMQQVAQLPAPPHAPNHQAPSAVPPHEFRHAARLVGCLSGLVDSLAPVGDSGQPRPQERALAEALVGLHVVQEACSMVWRLMPKLHGEPTSICAPSSPAWEQPVCINRPAGSNTHQEGISVRAAVTRLLSEVFTGLLGLHTWLEGAAGVGGVHVGGPGACSSSTSAVQPETSAATTAGVVATTAAAARQSAVAAAPPSAPRSSAAAARATTAAADSHVQQSGSSSSRVASTPAFTVLLSRLAQDCCALNMATGATPAAGGSSSIKPVIDRYADLLLGFVCGCFKALQQPQQGPGAGSSSSAGGEEISWWPCIALDFQVSHYLDGFPFLACCRESAAFTCLLVARC